ncbi:MAG: hypothetical protein CL908_11820 [Deltaproteobacteria bacterium]|nr:hypothetical protein [Deltaproteobacteria bacterium]
MCGVAGTLRRPGAAEILVHALRHRGPDHVAVIEHGVVAVGAARLRVTGDARGDMPLRSRSGRTLVVVNGEVFNHQELYPEASPASDLIGLPDLIESEGPAVLARIRGPFALIAIDVDAETMLVARDELGVRPLFVREENDGVLAGSEVRPLASVVPTPGRDETAWDFLLAFHFWPTDRTPVAGVRPVAPGTWRRYRMCDDGVEVETGAFAYRGGTDDLAMELDRAFRIQAPSRLKTGLTLSGGLDSSAVAALLAAHGCPPDVAATGFFPGADARFDERPHARAVAHELGIELIEVPITPDHYLEAWPCVLAALGGPLAGPGAPSQWLLSRALSAAGVGVVFSGQGGDELFGGYERHRRLLQRDLGLPPTPAPGYESLLPDDVADPGAALLFRGESLLPWLEPGRRAGVLAARGALPHPGRPLADRLLDFEVRTLLPGLLAVDDRTIAAFGMEGRVPLLDPVVARLARAVPLAEKSPTDAPRRLFRALVGDRLPRAAASRTDKMGFPVPLDAWLRGPWRELLHDHPALETLPDLGFKASVRDALRSGALSGRSAWFVLSVAFALADASAVSAAASTS